MRYGRLISAGFFLAVLESVTPPTSFGNELCLANFAEALELCRLNGILPEKGCAFIEGFSQEVCDSPTQSALKYSFDLSRARPPANQIVVYAQRGRFSHHWETGLPEEMSAEEIRAKARRLAQDILNYSWPAERAPVRQVTQASVRVVVRRKGESHAVPA